MLIQTKSTCDVFVAGAGIAGIMAAITAAENGQNVILSSTGAIFSGSSFYPGTWGLGLIAPENKADEDDLVQTILNVGCGMADEKMVRAFVSDISASVEYLKSLGVSMKKAQNDTQKDFIPCFDHKHRAWNGILFDSAKNVLSDYMEKLHIQLMPRCEVVDLICKNRCVRGVIVKKDGELFAVECKSAVLATGGYGGLFENRLTTDDVGGTGQYLAMKHGCKLVNMEFMQMMAGYISPCRKTIFNERTFRYTEMRDDNDEDIFKNLPNAQSLLAQRSTYGPFTSRLASKQIDFAIVNANAKNGVAVHYKKDLQENMPEFISTYFDWLYENKHLTPNDEIHIAMFAHAANGGIMISPNAETDTQGLFACGEVTGGMHGADRIGGLSTANGLVFGRKAGASAASYAAKSKEKLDYPIFYKAQKLDNVEETRKKLRETMTQTCMVVRTEAKLKAAVSFIDEALGRCSWTDTENADETANSRRLFAQLNLAKGILKAQMLRKESRGSHYREDYPDADVNLQKRIIVRMENGAITAYFE